MTLSASLPYFAQLVKNKIELALVPSTFNAVFYGDQNKIPSTPVVCVEPDNKTRELIGVPRKTQVTIDILLIVYHSKIAPGGGPQANRIASDEKVEELETFLHLDPQLGGFAIHSMVTRVESGYVSKQEAVLRASRLNFQILTQQMLPQSP
jgi:hypothetical protein